MTNFEPKTENQAMNGSSNQIKQRKFNKKVTWSNQLISVKIMSPDVNKMKLKQFSLREEDEDRFLAELNLL